MAHDKANFWGARAARRLRKIAGATVAITAMVSAIVLPAPTPADAVAVVGTDVTYTLDGQFDSGTLVNVNHDAPNNNQLQLNTTTETFPFIWVALSQRCTIAKVDTETGTILGEYRTLSDGSGCPESSRTTVALDGSVWVGHRFLFAVTHIGLPELNQCLDRNGNGTIETSAGYDDVLAWPGANAGVHGAVDECILHHHEVGDVAGMVEGDSRHMSIDADNKLWVGNRAGGSFFVRINGTTGVVETAVRDLPCGGYGGLIDGDGVIWSATSGPPLLRWDPDAPDGPDNPQCIGIDNYGLAADSLGNIWVSTLGGGVVNKLDSSGAVLGTFPHGASFAQGLAVDGNDHVWVSSSLFCGGACTVGHLLNDGTFVGNVANPTGSGSTGVSVDAAGKVWTANRASHTATRIDTAGGPLGCGGSGCAGGTTTIGAVDLTVDFPAGASGRPLPFPYNYSDMTGSQLLTQTQQGTWTVTQDSGAAGTEWGKVTWNTEPQGSEPAGTSITVEYRIAETEAGLGAVAFTTASNGASFSSTGRFIQVRATLKPDAAGVSPVLSDVRIQTAAPPEPPERAGGFSCRGSTLRVLNIEPVVSNPPNDPCVDDLESIVGPLTVGPVAAGVGITFTELDPDDLSTPPAAGDKAGANASVASAAIGLGPVIKVSAVAATARVQCKPGADGVLKPKFFSESSVAKVIIGGVPNPIGSAHVHITIPLVGTLHLNETIKSGNTITQRAVWLDLPGPNDIVIAEAKADYTGNPCVLERPV